MTLVRIVVAVLVVWFIVSLIALAQFHDGGSVPGEGRGDPIEVTNKP